MAIQLPQGFKIGSKEAIDSRIVLTKAEMLKMKDNTMPDVYFAMCKDDGKMYVYNKTNEIDPELGKFRVQDITAEQARAEAAEEALDNKIDALDDSLAAIAKTGNVNDLIQDDDDVLILNCNF